MKRILIFSGDGIGNIIQTTPAIKAIHSLGYEIDIVTWWGFEANKDTILEFFEQMPFINKAYTFFELNQVKFSDYDKVATFFLKPPMTGLEQRDNFLKVKYPELGSVNDVEMNMTLAKALGYRGETFTTWCPYSRFAKYPKFDLVFSMGCNPNPFWARKKWPHFKKLAELLKDKKIAVVGHANEGIDESWSDNVTDYCGKLGFLETCSLIKQVGKIVSVDNGMAHSAAALGARVFVVWGPTSLLKCEPKGETFIIQRTDLECQPCQRFIPGKFVSTWENCAVHECMDIPAEKVVEVIKQNE